MYNVNESFCDLLSDDGIQPQCLYTPCLYTLFKFLFCTITFADMRHIQNKKKLHQNRLGAVY